MSSFNRGRDIGIQTRHSWSSIKQLHRDVFSRTSTKIHKAWCFGKCILLLVQKEVTDTTLVSSCQNHTQWMPCAPIGPKTLQENMRFTTSCIILCAKGPLAHVFSKSISLGRIHNGLLANAMFLQITRYHLWEMLIIHWCDNQHIRCHGPAFSLDVKSLRRLLCARKNTSSVSAIFLRRG